MADLVSRSLGERLAGLRGWTGLYPEELALRPELQEGLLKAVARAVPGASSVALIDQRSVPVVEPTFVEFNRATELIGRLPVAAALDHGLEIGTPYRYQGSPVPSLPVALRATAHEPWLILGAEIELDVVLDLRDRETPDHVVVLLDGRGETIVGGDHPLTNSALLAPLIGNRAYVTYPAHSGLEVTGATAPVEGTEWTVAVLVPHSAIDRTAREIELRLGWVVLLSAGLSVLAAFLLGRSLSAPIATLRDVAVQVGEGNFGVRAEVARSDEIGDLARAFDRMSARLATNARQIDAQRTEIEAFNRELQSRVERRTRELRDAQDRLVRSGQLAAVAEVGAGLAHELNNPLAGILGATQLLRSRGRDPRDALLLADLERLAGRCREVVSTMLRLSAASSGSPAAHADIRAVLSEATHLVSGAFRQRGVALKLHVSAEPLLVRCDPVAGSRLFAQILNALRAGLPDGAGLTVSAGRRSPGSVEIVLVPDRPVALGDSRDDWMAAGLGLWVARRLLDEIGGRLEEPNAPADGTEEIDRTALAAGGMVDAPWFVVLPEG